MLVTEAGSLEDCGGTGQDGEQGAKHFLGHSEAPACLHPHPQHNSQAELGGGAAPSTLPDLALAMRDSVSLSDSDSEADGPYATGRRAAGVAAAAQAAEALPGAGGLHGKWGTGSA